MNNTITETVGSTPATSGTTNAQLVHNGYNDSGTLNAASTPPVTKMACFHQALSTGTATIDLTALVGSNAGTVSGSGLKVQWIKLKAVTAAGLNNGNTVNIAVGASNGYELAGAGFDVTLQPGQIMAIYGNDATPDISGSAKDLDMTGTGSTDGFEVTICMG
jgi:hypothetical protein